MAFKFTLLILPVLALAKIDIHIFGQFKSDRTKVKVDFEGSDTRSITDADWNYFNLTYNNLKNAAELQFKQRPANAFLHNKKGELYQLEGWRQINRTIIPQISKILKISYEPEIINKKVYENKGREPVTYNVGISQYVQNNVSSSWSTGGELSVSEMSSYDIILDVLEVDGDIAFSYISSWGNNVEQSYTMKMGETSNMDVVIKPDQSVNAQLHATRVSIQLEIQYEVGLTGLTGCLYGAPHSPAIDIGACLNEYGLSNQKLSQEVIDINLYIDYKLMINYYYD